MTIPVSTDLTPFTVPAADPSQPDTVYYLKVPSYYDRAHFNRELQMMGVENASIRGILRATREALIQHLDAAQLDEMTGYLDKYEEQELFSRVEFTDEQRQLVSVVDGIIAQMSELSEDLRRERANFNFYWSVMPVLAAQMFIVKAEPSPASFERKHGKLTDAALHAIPQGDVRSIGHYVFGLMTLTDEQRKNLLTPSGSVPAQANSKGLTPATPDGRSKAGGRAKTPKISSKAGQST